MLKVEFIWKTDSEYLTTASVANEPSSSHLSMVKYPNSPRTDVVTFSCYLIADGILAATRSVTERMQFGGEFQNLLKLTVAPFFIEGFVFIDSTVTVRDDYTRTIREGEL